MLRAIMLLYLLTPFYLYAPSAEASTDVIKVGTYEWLPFKIIQEEQTKGIDDDLLQQVAQHLGVNIQYVRCPWARCLLMMRKGELDLMMDLAWREERAEYIDYVHPAYFSCNTRFYIRKEGDVLLLSEADLAPLTIGMVLESAYYPAFDQNTTLNKRKLPQESALLPLLAAKRIHTYIGTDCQADYELNNSQWKGLFVKAPYNPEHRTAIYMGLSKASAWQSRKPEIEAALIKVLEAGFEQQVLQKYYQ